MFVVLIFWDLHWASPVSYTHLKLVDRGTKMLMERIKITDYETAKELLLKYGSVKKAADSFAV